MVLTRPIVNKAHGVPSEWDPSTMGKPGEDIAGMATEYIMQGYTFRLILFWFFIYYLFILLNKFFLGEISPLLNDVTCISELLMVIIQLLTFFYPSFGVRRVQQARSLPLASSTRLPAVLKTLDWRRGTICSYSLPNTRLWRRIG